MRSSIVVGCLVMGGLLVGCGDESGEDGSKDSPSALKICTPDPDLVAQKRRCQVDDDCPCGTHCSLGQCAASCTEAADCADGEVCDSFGRCRQADEAALVPVPRQQAEGLLALDTPRVYFDETGEAVATIRVERRDVSRVRVVASNGAEVQCPGASDYASDCELTELSAGDSVEVSVRRAEGADPTTTAELTVYGPGNTESASMLDVGQGSEGNVPLNNASVEPVPVAGRYEGTLRLVGAGTDADLDNLPAPPAAVASDLTATVWEDGGEFVIAVDDELGYLTSRDTFTGKLSLGSDDDADGRVEGTGSFVAHPFIDDAVVAGRTNALIVETVDATVLSRLNPRTLSLSLTQSYRGLGMDVAPTVRWVVQLQRTADADGAPQLPQAAQLGFDPQQRLAELSPWEAAFDANMFPGSWVFQVSITNSLNPGEHSGPPELPSLCADGLDEGRRDAHRLFSQVVLGHRPNWLSENYYDPTLWDSPAWISRSLFTDAYAQHSAYTPATTGGELVLSPTPDFFEEGIVCGVEQMAVAMEFPDGVTTTATKDAADVCDLLMEATGCRVEAIDEPVDLTVQFDWVETAELTPTRVTAQVKRRCVLPSLSATCGEQIACLGPATERVVGDDGSRFTQDTVPHIGDLTCEGNELTGGLAFDRDAAELTADMLFDRCMTDVAKLADPAPAPQNERLVGDLFDVDAECVDVPRLLTAVTTQGRSLRPGKAPLNKEAEARASAYTQRMLVRWLEIHGFFAAESVQREKVADVFRQEQEAAGELPAPGTVLQASLRGWDMLLDPAVAIAVYKVGAGALEEPDYRIHRHGLAGLPDDEVTQGLAPVIMQTLARQSELMHRYIDKRSRGVEFGEGEDNLLALMMPRMLVAQTMAAELRRRAAQTGGNIPWMDSLDSAAARAQARFGEAASLIASLRSGANPLGIEDEDLPLYFLADDADGPGGRFSAISDFIAGTGPGSNAWAPAAVAKAQESLTEARAAYIAESERKVRQARSDRDLSRWVEDVRNESNATLRDYCGPIVESPVDDPDFNAATCMLNPDNPACSTDLPGWYNRWTDADIMGRLCLHTDIERYSLDDAYGFFSEALRTFASQCYTEQGRQADDPVSIGACQGSSSEVCLRCEWKEGVEEVSLARATFELNVPSASGSTRAWVAAQASCQRLHPGMRLNVPRPNNPLETPGCVRGSIGEAYLDVVDAAADVDSARQAIVEHKEAYDIAMESCLILEEGNEDLAEAREAHKANMDGLRVAKTTAEGVAIAAGAVKECAATAAGSDSTSPWGAIKGSVSTALACGAGAAEAVADITANSLGAVMDGAQAAHESLVAGIEERTELRICFNDAKHELVGLKAATMDLEGAVFALERANARVQEQIADAQREYEDGHAYLKEVGSWPMPDAAGDKWGNERVNRYLRDFKLARRATYLAVRAVEYEYQQSLGARQDVIDAKTPVDLESVLQTLWSTAATRSINGSRPSELTAVLSLRDDILQLGDESAWPDSMRPLSVEERFHVLLSSQRYAEYDEAGAYMGQRIPFTLAPLEAFDFESGGVPLYAQTDCAERLWAVNAGIVGQDAYAGSDTTVTRIDLLKRNTFFSQRCTDPADGEGQFQYASVRPTRNLFRDPGVGAPEGTSAEAQGVEAYSRARIQAFMGVDRATLEDPQYANGETSELAARGLYGDYALFIPAALISRDGQDGLVLDRIDDILLRVDYLSVARR